MAGGGLARSRGLAGPGDAGAEEGPTYGPGELDDALLRNSGLEAVLPKRDPLSAMPSDPRALAAWLNATAARQVPGRSRRVRRDAVITDALALLRDARATPSCALALIDVLSTLDGRPEARVGPRRRRPRVAGHRARRQAIAYDPRSGELMARGDRFDGRRALDHDLCGGQRAASAAIGDRP